VKNGVVGNLIIIDRAFYKAKLN